MIREDLLAVKHSSVVAMDIEKCHREFDARGPRCALSCAQFTKLFSTDLAQEEVWADGESVAQDLAGVMLDRRSTFSQTSQCESAPYSSAFIHAKLPGLWARLKCPESGENEALAGEIPQIEPIEKP